MNHENKERIGEEVNVGKLRTGGEHFYRCRIMTIAISVD